MQLRDVIDTNDTVYIITEYIPNGDLSEYMKRKLKLKEHEAWRYF